MDQQLKSNTLDRGLTTADLAQTRKPASASSEFDGNADRTTSLPDSHRSFLQQDGSFVEQRDEAEDPEGLRTPEVIRGRATASSGEESAAAPLFSPAAPLFSPAESDDFHRRWAALQTSFVDEPRQAVQEADGLVAGAMKRLAEIFADERATLDQQWDRGDSVSTEDLRLALRRYRSFFGRLLSV